VVIVRLAALLLLGCTVPAGPPAPSHPIAVSMQMTDPCYSDLFCITDTVTGVCVARLPDSDRCEDIPARGVLAERAAER